MVEVSSNRFDVAEDVSRASVDSVREISLDELHEYDWVTVVVKELYRSGRSNGGSLWEDERGCGGG